SDTLWAEVRGTGGFSFDIDWSEETIPPKLLDNFICAGDRRRGCPVRERAAIGDANFRNRGIGTHRLGVGYTGPCGGPGQQPAKQPADSGRALARLRANDERSATVYCNCTQIRRAVRRLHCNLVKAARLSTGTDQDIVA